MLDDVEVLLDRVNPKAESLRILHLSDPHVYNRAACKRLMLDHLSSRKLDLVVLCGDYMVRGGDVQPGLDWLEHVSSALRPRLGFVGIFGNHDEPELRERATDLPIHWLDDAVKLLPDLGLMIAGQSTRCGIFDGHSDVSKLIAQVGRARREGMLTSDMLILIVAHVPSSICFMDAIGANWVFSGHTHGGQVRLPNGWTPIDLGLPGGYNAGVFRLREVLMTVSRGMGGRRWMPRVFCPTQIPLYTLHRGPRPPSDTGALCCVEVW